VREVVAAQMRDAVARGKLDSSLPRVELYETDPRKANAMPFSTTDTIRKM